MTLPIEHQLKQQRFVIDCEGEQAILEYQSTSGAVEFTSTHVPSALRGKGLAELLVAAALQWAQRQQLEISSSCWYVDKFL